MATAAAGQRHAPSILRVFSQPKMAAILFLGFSSGLPLYLTSQNLQAWMTVEGVDLTTIGLFSLVTLPYSLKFLWAPLMDRYVPPIFGRRRGWLFVTQIALMLSIAAMSLQDPSRALQLVAFNAILIAFFSASQDVVFDAYRIDVLDEREMGAGAALGVMGYRIAMIVVGGLGLILADQMPWPMVYLLMAALMLVGLLATWRAPNPTDETPPDSLAAAVVHPFLEFFRRTGVVWGIIIVLFVIAFQLPDRFGQNMATPFLLEVGYTQTEIGAIRGVIGIGATILGVIIGGAPVAKTGLNRSA